MNLFRTTALFLFLFTALTACSNGESDASNQPIDSKQVKADSAAQQITDAMNQNNASIEARDPVLPSTDGKLFKADLLNAINRADKIIITEHSNKNDYSDPDAGVIYQGPAITYGQVELSDKQRAEFSSVISGLSDETQDAFAACICSPHHSIHFYVDGKLSDTMEVCFKCGKIEWQGSTRTPPGSIYSGLSQVVKSVGLSPERDWSRLAKPNRNK